MAPEMKRGYLNITIPRPHLSVEVKNKMSILEGSRVPPGAQRSADEAGVGKEEQGQRSQTAPETDSAQNYDALMKVPASHLPLILATLIKSDSICGGMKHLPFPKA